MKIVQTNTPEDLAKLSRAEFHKLWFKDALTERQIAKKFGVTKEEVHARRKELNLTWLNSALLSMMGGNRYNR